MESHYVICLFLSGWKVAWTDNMLGVSSVFLCRGTDPAVCCTMCVCVCVGGWVWSTTQQCSAFHLEQQLVLHDPLNRFDKQVIELQPVAQLLPQLLTEQYDTSQNWNHATKKKTKRQQMANNPAKIIYHRDYTVYIFVMCLRVNEKELITFWIINGRGNTST